MKFPLRHQPIRNGLFGGLSAWKVAKNPPAHDGCSKAFFLLGDTLWKSIVLQVANVVFILCMCCQTQIVQAVVHRVSVNVVGFHSDSQIMPVHRQNHTSRDIPSPIDSNFHSAIFLVRSCDHSSSHFASVSRVPSFECSEGNKVLPWTRLPNQVTVFGDIHEQGVKSLHGWETSKLTRRFDVVALYFIHGNKISNSPTSVKEILCLT